MTGEGYFLLTMVLLLVVMVILWLDDVLFKPKRRTRPPVEKILELVENESGFIIHNGHHLVPEKVKERQFVDYTLEDRITKKLTWLGRYPMHDTPCISGDFKWFNCYEARRLYGVVEKIGDRQKEAKNEEESKARYARNEDLRKKAEETYKYR
ncbi:hypothetical protein CHUUTOTORO_00780 [Serratia phage vB_SmaM-ChuuTotoro]|nr:hypothetical protein CHUUTOTORO_00780 [Serratia phage vB_SmaM-ChuuTotoro]